MDKQISSNGRFLLEAYLKDGMTIAAGGFGLCGIPENLIKAIADSGIKNLTIIGNNMGTDEKGMGLLLKNNQVSKVIASFVGDNKEFERQVLAGALELELCPQGTLAEKLRAGGAGIPAFYTKTASGTILAKNKETRTFSGSQFVLEHSLRADLSIIKSHVSDRAGNLRFRKTARNFNPMIATCGDVCVVECEEYKSDEFLNPDDVHLPGIYIDSILIDNHYEKTIEFPTTLGFKASGTTAVRENMAKRASLELKTGDYVNLGIGIPTLVANYVNTNDNIIFQSENGLLGIGPFPIPEELDADLINAGKQTISTTHGSSFFSSADSFAMIRGGHIDVSILGGLEVSETGDLANFMIPGKMVKGPGGAMDLVSGVKKVVVLLEHRSKQGDSKILKKCKLPLTGKGVVNLIITDLAVFEILPEGAGLLLTEVMPSSDLEEIKQFTEAEFMISEKLIYRKPTFQNKERTF